MSLLFTLSSKKPIGIFIRISCSGILIFHGELLFLSWNKLALLAMKPSTRQSIRHCLPTTWLPTLSMFSCGGTDQWSPIEGKFRVIYGMHVLNTFGLTNWCMGDFISNKTKFGNLFGKRKIYGYFIIFPQRSRLTLIEINYKNMNY